MVGCQVENSNVGDPASNDGDSLDLYQEGHYRQRRAKGTSDVIGPSMYLYRPLQLECAPSISGVARERDDYGR